MNTAIIWEWGIKNTKIKKNENHPHNRNCAEIQVSVGKRCTTIWPNFLNDGGSQIRFFSEFQDRSPLKTLSLAIWRQYLFTLIMFLMLGLTENKNTYHIWNIQSLNISVSSSCICLHSAAWEERVFVSRSVRDLWSRCGKSNLAKVASEVTPVSLAWRSKYSSTLEF